MSKLSGVDMQAFIKSKPSKPIKKPDYQIEETANGRWKIHFDENGNKFSEYRSHAELFDLPLVSIVHGRDPLTKKMVTARGIVAIGNRAAGVVSIGQFSQGYIAIGQFCTGRFFGFGQFVVAPIGIGQFSLAVLGLGQIGVSMAGIYQMGATLLGGIGQIVYGLF